MSDRIETPYIGLDDTHRQELVESGYKIIEDTDMAIGGLHLQSLSWRGERAGVSVRRQPWHTEDIVLPLSALAVRPSRVLYWDNSVTEPRRENSLQRAMYMMIMRTLSVELADRNDGELRARISSGPTATLLGYAASRENTLKVVKGYFKERVTVKGGLRYVEPPQAVCPGGHLRKAAIRTHFRYMPPQDKPSQERLVALIRSAAEDE